MTKGILDFTPLIPDLSEMKNYETERLSDLLQSIAELKRSLTFETDLFYQRISDGRF
ncbi:MAG: hypothetical protein AAGF85_04030 [Bacteroidota bacterium]